MDCSRASLLSAIPNLLVIEKRAKSEIIFQPLLPWKCQVALFIQGKWHSQIWSQGIPELTGRILFRSDWNVWNKISWASWPKGPDEDDDDEVFYTSSQTTQLELISYAGSVSVQMTTLLSSLSTHWHCLFHCSWSVKRCETMELKLLFEKGCFWWNLQTISFTL